MPRKYRKSPTYKLKKRYGRKATKAATTIQSAIRRAIAQNNNRMLETKTSFSTADDGQEMFHNTLVTRSSNLLITSQGVQDNEVGNGNNRIGDKITLRGLSIKVMLELNERYSMGTFRIFVVRSAKGDTPSTATLFAGNSGNKMIDNLNTDRYTIIASKTITIKQTSTGMGESGIQEVGSGFTKGTPLISRASKIVKMWIPGKKFSRSGVIQYENQSVQPKFFNYHLLYYAYSNYSTNSTYYVGRVNDEVIGLYYKDA